VLYSWIKGSRRRCYSSWSRSLLRREPRGGGTAGISLFSCRPCRTLPLRCPRTLPDACRDSHAAHLPVTVCGWISSFATYRLLYSSPCIVPGRRLVAVPLCFAVAHGFVWFVPRYYLAALYILRQPCACRAAAVKFISRCASAFTSTPGSSRQRLPSAAMRALPATCRLPRHRAGTGAAGGHHLFELCGGATAAAAVWHSSLNSVRLRYRATPLLPASGSGFAGTLLTRRRAGGGGKPPGL